MQSKTTLRYHITCIKLANMTEEETKAIHNHMKNCSKSLLIREMKIKITLGYYLTHIRLANVT